MKSKIVAGVLVFTCMLVSTEGVCKTESLTEAEQDVLDKHNELRALYEDTDPLCYGESGEDVTFTADRHAFETAMEAKKDDHSVGQAFGENIDNSGVGRSDGYVTGRSDAYLESTGDWYREKLESPNAYNQILWKSSKQLNCGLGRWSIKRDQVTWFFNKVVCQYYPPGNIQAGAEVIGDAADNIGALKPVPCKKPGVWRSDVTPDSDTVNEGEKFTVTCMKKLKLEGEGNTLTCNKDGSLTPASHTFTCTNGAARGGTLSLAVFFMFITIILN